MTEAKRNRTMYVDDLLLCPGHSGSMTELFGCVEEQSKADGTASIGKCGSQVMVAGTINKTVFAGQVTDDGGSHMYLGVCVCVCVTIATFKTTRSWLQENWSLLAWG